jgi:hypothetical protein
MSARTIVRTLRRLAARVERLYDQRTVRRQFVMSLANMDHLHIFWCPRRDRLYARSARRPWQEAYKPQRGRGGAVPPSARYVGTYTHPYKADEFLEDLDALITRLDADERATHGRPAEAFALA